LDTKPTHTHKRNSNC